MRLGHACERSHPRLHPRWQLTSETVDGAFAAPNVTTRAVTGRRTVSRRDLWEPPMSPTAGDPLAPLTTLPGVAEAGEDARDALGKAHRHRANLRGWPVDRRRGGAARRAGVVGARRRTAAVRAGRRPRSGARRCAARRPGARRRGRGAGRRVAARTAAGASPGCTRWPRRTWSTTTQLGRPRAIRTSDARLELLADLATGGTRVPATVLAAVAHGELLTLAPFGSRRRCGGACGVQAGHHRQRLGSARSRSAGGALDAALRRLPRGGAGASRPGRRTV